MKKTARLILSTTVMACLLVSCSCGVHAPVPSNPSPDNSYLDLNPGQKLSIVVPLLKSGKYRLDTSAAVVQGNVITLSASDLLGYERYRYTAERRGRGRVVLRLEGAVVSRNGGETTADKNPPPLPFPLPPHPRHIRLIYFIRSSQSDHNMAIAAADKRGTLEEFTNQLTKDPQVCRTSRAVFCSWVPLGVALRPE